MSVLMSMGLETQVRLFSAIRPGSTYSQVSRDSRITYSHVFKTLNSLQEEGFVETVKKGRKRVVTLTKKGKDLKGKLQNIGNGFDDTKGTAKDK